MFSDASKIPQPLLCICRMLILSQVSTRALLSVCHMSLASYGENSFVNFLADAKCHCVSYQSRAVCTEPLLSISGYVGSCWHATARKKTGSQNLLNVLTTAGDTGLQRTTSCLYHSFHCWKISGPGFLGKGGCSFPYLDSSQGQ